MTYVDSANLRTRYGGDILAATSDIANWGELYIPSGNPEWAAGATVVPPNRGLTRRIRGAGIGSTAITMTADASAFVLKDFLTSIYDLQIVGMAGSTKPGIEIASPPSMTIGRVGIKRVQVTGFKDGLLIDPFGFDQVWVEQSLFNGNSQDGIHASLTQSGSAMLHTRDCITDNNGRHGLNLYSSAILAHAMIDNHEAANNGADQMRVEGSGTNTLVSVQINNPDLEGTVEGGSALRMTYVWKAGIREGQYSALKGHTADAAVWLDHCRDVSLENPWVRQAADGMGALAKPLYVTGADSQEIRKFGSHYFGTQLPWTLGPGVPATAVMG